MTALQHSLTCAENTTLPPAGRAAWLCLVRKGDTSQCLPHKCLLGTAQDLLLLPQALPSAFLQGRELFTQESCQESDGPIRIIF